MIKWFLKNSFYIITALFFIGVVLVVFVREHLVNELYVMIINYYFWYTFGLLSGVYLARLIIEKYTKMIKRNKYNEHN